MGVIALTVYPEEQRREGPGGLSQALLKGGTTRGTIGQGRRGRPQHRFREGGVFSGTLGGVRTRAAAAEKIYIKYAWRSMLCRQELISCGTPKLPWNRMWDDDGFAPPHARRSRDAEPRHEGHRLAASPGPDSPQAVQSALADSAATRVCTPHRGRGLRPS